MSNINFQEKYLFATILNIPLAVELIFGILLTIIHSQTVTHSAYSVSAYFLGVAVGTLFWSFLSLLIPVKKIILNALLLSVISLTGLIISSHFLFIFFRFLVGFSITAFRQSIQTLCRSLYNNNTLINMYSFLSASAWIIIAVCPLLAYSLSKLVSWRFVFVILILLFIDLYRKTKKIVVETSVKENLTFKGMCTIVFQYTKIKWLKIIFMYALPNFLTSLFYSYGKIYMISKLGYSEYEYLALFAIISLSTMGGGLAYPYFRKKWHALECMKIFFSVLLFFFILAIRCYSISSQVMQNFIAIFSLMTLFFLSTCIGASGVEIVNYTHDDYTCFKNGIFLSINFMIVALLMNFIRLLM